MATLVVSNNSQTATEQPSLTAPVPTITHSQRVSSGNGLQPGAVAGITIGIAIGVAIVTALVVLLLMRKRYSSRMPEGEPDSDAKSSQPNRHRRRRKKSNKAPSGQSAPAMQKREEIVPSVDFDRDLPQPIPDSDLRMTIRDLSTAIKNHVTDCYHRDHIDKSLPLGHTEPKLIENPGARIEAIRQRIAKTILDNIEPTGDPSRTFLPPKIVSILSSTPEMPSKENQFLTVALSRWRTITKFILFPSNKHRSPEYQPNLKAIRHAAEEISDELKDYEKSALSKRRHSHGSVTPPSHHECVKGLERVLLQGANFGIDLLSQGAAFSYGGWDVRELDGKSSQRQYLIVFPDVMRETDENGYRLAESITIYMEVAEEVSWR